MTAYGTVVGEILFESDAHQPDTFLYERESPVNWLYECDLDPDEVDEDRRILAENLRQDIILTVPEV